MRLYRFILSTRGLMLTVLIEAALFFAAITFERHLKYKRFARHYGSLERRSLLIVAGDSGAIEDAVWTWNTNRVFNVVHAAYFGRMRERFERAASWPFSVEPDPLPE